MDVIEQWSQRMAQRVVPAEVDFAAEVGLAYAAGGQARENLLPRPGAQPGAFGPDNFAVELPMILRALADAGNALLWLLRSPYLSNGLAAGAIVVALRAGRDDDQPSEPVRPEAQPLSSSGPSPLPASEKQAVEQAFTSLRDRLTAAGFPRQRADLLAYELLEELLADAGQAALFLDALTAVPERSARPSASPKTGRGRRGRRH